MKKCMRQTERGEDGSVWFWWFMLLSDLLVPVIMLICGRKMWKHCPQHIEIRKELKNAAAELEDVKYKVMKNMDTWKFAHDYCGRLWWKTGWLMMLPSVLVPIPFYHGDEKTIGIVGTILVTIQCMVLIASVFPTERALKKTFYDNGTRR